MRKLLKKHGFAPTQVTTDKLRSYGAAFRDIGLLARHEQGRRQNNRAEVSHQPVRRRERKMHRFKSPGSAQRFVAMHSAADNTFTVQRHLIDRRGVNPSATPGSPRIGIVPVTKLFRRMSADFAPEPSEPIKLARALTEPCFCASPEPLERVALGLRGIFRSILYPK